MRWFCNRGMTVHTSCQKPNKLAMNKKLSGYFYGKTTAHYIMPLRRDRSLISLGNQGETVQE